MIEKIRLAKVTSELEKNVGLFSWIKEPYEFHEPILLLQIYGIYGIMGLFLGLYYGIIFLN